MTKYSFWVFAFTLDDNGDIVDKDGKKLKTEINGVVIGTPPDNPHHISLDGNLELEAGRCNDLNADRHIFVTSPPFSGDPSIAADYVNSGDGQTLQRVCTNCVMFTVTDHSST